MVRQGELEEQELPSLPEGVTWKVSARAMGTLLPTIPHTSATRIHDSWCMLFCSCVDLALFPLEARFMPSTFAAKRLDYLRALAVSYGTERALRSGACEFREWNPIDIHVGSGVCSEDS